MTELSMIVYTKNRSTIPPHALRLVVDQIGIPFWDEKIIGTSLPEGFLS